MEKLELVPASAQSVDGFLKRFFMIPEEARPLFHVHNSPSDSVRCIAGAGPPGLPPHRPDAEPGGGVGAADDGAPGRLRPHTLPPSAPLRPPPPSSQTPGLVRAWSGCGTGAGRCWTSRAASPSASRPTSTHSSSSSNSASTDQPH